MNRTKKASLSVKSGLSLMCIVCLLCGLLCGFFWLAGESSALAAGPDGSALAAKAVVSGDASLAAPERDEKLAVQAAAQATSPVVRTVAVGMDAGDYTETVTCDYTPVYVDDRFGGYCYVLGDAVWLPADAFAEMLGLESDTVTDGDTETVTVDGADITATYGATYYTANGRCFYAPDGVYALDGEVVLPLADLEKIFGVTAAFSADNTSLRVDASEQALLESGESYYGARDVYWLSRGRQSAHGRADRGRQCRAQPRGGRAVSQQRQGGRVRPAWRCGAVFAHGRRAHQPHAGRGCRARGEARLRGV